MAHNSRRNRRDSTTHADDEYVYPTKKIRETKTRNRKRDKNLIKAGLIDQANQDDTDANDWYSDEPMSQHDHDQEMMDDYNEMIVNFNAAEEEDINDADDFDSHMDFDDVNTDWDHRWEDY